MIKANELRIGNWVKRDSQPNGFQIDSRSFRLVELHPEWYEPIELSPEILEKAGFEEFEFHFICHECVRLKVNEIWYKKSAPNVKATVLHYQIKHLHQLQNLYFALTGEELIIKEETPA